MTKLSGSSLFTVTLLRVIPSVGKTTRSNPGAFQKVPPKTLLMILKKIARKTFNGQTNSVKNLLTVEFLNYLSQYKRKNLFYCNLCKSESPYYYHTANAKRILYNSICPNCSSRKRHRGLYEIYKNILKKMDLPRVLHFAPEPVFYSLFTVCEYITADIELEDVDLQLDIEKIDCQDNSFNLILCNHVLEHIKDDLTALKELQRILIYKGILVLTVPGDWRRKETIEYKIPDNNGHYRDYGLEFIDLLNNIFNKVEKIDLHNFNHTYEKPLGLTSKHDLAFLCYKN